MLLLIFSGCGAESNLPQNLAKEDAYAYLEEVQSDASLSWVRSQNELSKKALADGEDFEALRLRFLTVLNSKERIPYVQKIGEKAYNFWRDEKNVRGVFRKTSFAEYAKEEPKWESVIDLDDLAQKEGENWTWKGFSLLYPSQDLILVYLSRGGSDATVVREFDLEKGQFVADGFILPEAKSKIAWKDRDTIYVGTDFGPSSLTQSGYPRIVKEWKRGEELANAKVVFEGSPEDVAVEPVVVHSKGRVYEIISRIPTFFTNEIYLLKDGSFTKIDKPADTSVGYFKNELLFQLRKDWKTEQMTYSAGSLLAIDVDKYLQGSRNFWVLFQPTERSSLETYDTTQNYLILNVLENVQNKILLLQERDGAWVEKSFDAPSFGTVNIFGIDPDLTDEYFMVASDYLTPTTLWMGDLKTNFRIKVKNLPSFFRTDDLEITQNMAVSKDGTQIPYFQVNKKGMVLDGNNPTLLYGYGGFEISMQPTYQPLRGMGWLEKGGVYVEANIRGGGEFGPKWHEAACKLHRQRAFDDFIAVGEDLIAKKVTSPKRLAIQGGSNGGLLMGVMLTQRPDLWSAVVCQVPLLDMLRYHKLLAGASWMEEYGDPDKEEERAFLKSYSPYHNLKPFQKYPSVFFTTSTKDDRVHPGHARKMAAKMKDLGNDVLYYENTEGGHAGAVNNEQIAHKIALEYMFLNQKIMDK